VKKDDIHEIEKILKMGKPGGKVEYFVKWESYPENSKAG
jgi:hypothetical protein